MENRKNKSLSHIIKKGILEATEKSGLLRMLQGLGRSTQNGLYVLTYHRVDEPGRLPWLTSDIVTATPQAFEQQMELVSRFYHPVSAEEILDAVEKKHPLPPNAVFITVDDGYCDFKDNIFPIAYNFGIRPLLFLTTGFVGHGIFWWDKLHIAVKYAAGRTISSSLGDFPVDSSDEKTATYDILVNYFKKEPSFEKSLLEIEALYNAATEKFDQERVTLTWDELRSLDRQGATIAAHTHTHPILSHIPDERIRFEVNTSQEQIKKEIGHALPIFGYPDGRPASIPQSAIEILREEGFKLAFTMVRRYADLVKDNLLFLPRVGLWHQPLAQFHMKLIPLYYAVRSERWSD
jgi:peptidoglycan/xylan/chitin deacetylase (PgdA/CDA1 family)